LADEVVRETRGQTWGKDGVDVKNFYHHWWLLYIFLNELVEPDLTPSIPRHVFKYKGDATAPEEDHH
jgi:hypothetical protein